MRFGKLSFFSRLVAGYSAAVLLMIALGTVALTEVRSLASLNERMFRHPLTVSNATLEIKALVLSIHRDMRSMALDPRPQQAERFGAEIEIKDRQLDQRLILIRERYLGDQKDIDAVETTLVRWHAFRDESVRLLQAGRRDVFLERTLGEGNQLAKKAEEEADRIVAFARAKAASFHVEVQEVEDRAAWQVGIAVALAAVAMLGMAALVTRSIGRQVGTLGRSMVGIAAGESGVRVPYTDYENEIGEMARTVDVFKSNAEQLARRHWVKTHAASLAFDLQAIGSVGKLCEDVLGRLAGLLGAGHGALFLFDEKSATLELTAGYALADGTHRQARLQLGEGVVGQCARERKPIVLSPLPDNYVRVSSAVGEAIPVCLHVLPMVGNGRLIGVVELAFFAAPGERHRELLDEVLPLLALNLDSLERAAETRRLLNESQLKSEELAASQEELQAQQEELAENNRELQDRNAALQTSEEELRAANEQVQEKSQLLEQAMTDLNERATMLDRASRYKSEFLANMSHELRTPLNSLLILAKDLADNGDGNLTEDQVESARVILDGGQNLLRLINDILDLSKVEAGKLDVRRDRVALSSVLAYLDKTFGHMAAAKGIAFSVVQGPGVPAAIESDSGRIEQILTNLIGNALKFTERGSITVRLSVLPEGTVPVGCSCEHREGFLAIAVADSGIGIPADKLTTIFGAFEQIDAGPRRRYGGSGLGLAISQKLARLLGGCLIVESEPDVGSTFTLYLPVAQPKRELVADSRPVVAAAAGLPDDRDGWREGDESILVVEDDLAFAAIVGSLVRKKGYRLLHAADGAEGLALAQRFQPLGIVLDEMLPSLEGHEIVSRMRADPATQDIPVHFISVLNVVEGMGEHGVLGCLTKPVSRGQIERVIERLERAGIRQSGRLLVVAAAGEAETVAAHFGRRMAEVGVAHSVAEGLQRIRRSGADVLILDPALPDEDGIAMLERLESPPPVVVYSSAELLSEQILRLRAFTDSIVIKSEHSLERLTEEVATFLHRVGHRSGAEDAVPATARRFDGKSMLVVDDDMRNLFALAKVLRGRGFRVVMAKNGLRALEQAESAERIDAVLMDIMMPEMDGYETMRRLRRMQGFDTTPIVAVTALAMVNDREKCLEAGADEYLAKPVVPERLFEVLDQLLPA